MRRALLPLLFALSCASPRDAFIEGHLKDECDASWPVCTTTAGCVVTPASYLEGHFPGARRLIVRTNHAATIGVELLLDGQVATGKETRIVFHEAGCGTQEVASVDGRALFDEADSQGTFRREAKVFKAGDHLIDVTSDASTAYLLRVTVAEEGAAP